MSDAIKHECGLAHIRLLKPLSYYLLKYGTALYGLNKLYLLMEKQHNRGQDGAGVATIKFDVPPGTRYISRYRSTSPTAIKDIFGKINDKFSDVNKKNPERLKDLFDSSMCFNPGWGRHCRSLFPNLHAPAAGNTASGAVAMIAG